MTKFACFVNSYDLWIFLANAMIDETAYSAIEAGEYDGTLPTRIPASLHCSSGMLSNPAEQQSIS